MIRIIVVFLLVLAISSCSKETKIPNDSADIKPSVYILLKEKKQKYDKMINENYDSSRIVLQKLLFSLDTLSESNKKYAAQFYSSLANEEFTKQGSFISDSLMRIAKKLLINYNDSADYCKFYLNQGLIFRKKGENDSAVLNYRKALSLAKRYKDTLNLIPSMTNLGTVMLEQNNSDEGIEFLKAALRICNEDKHLQNKADLCNNLGVVYERRGNYTTALEYYLSSISLMEKIGSPQNFLNPINNMANIYLDLGNDSLALINYLKVNEIAGKIKNPQLEATSLINLGNLYYTKHNLTKAYQYSNDALFILESLPESYLHSVLYLNMGAIEKDNRNFEKALLFLNKSLKISSRLHSINTINEGRLHLAQVYLEQNKYDPAKKLALETYYSAQENHNLDFSYKTALILGKAFKGLNETKNALKFYDLYEKHYSQYSDTLNTKQNKTFAYRYELQKNNAKNKQLLLQQRIQEHEILTKEQQIYQQKILIILGFVVGISLSIITGLYVFKTKAKHKTNRILESKNKEIQEKNMHLLNENKFKNKLFSIVSHDIKSPLIALHNFLTLLEMGELDEKGKEELRNETMAKTEVTLNMVEDLLLWTRQQLNETPAQHCHINFCELLDEVLRMFSSVAKEKNLKIIKAFEGEIWISSDPNIVKMLIRNLISNSLKFTPSGGKITIDLKRSKKDFTISVKDTGKGIPLEHQSKIFNEEDSYSSSGDHMEAGHGIGLKLCKYFVEKNNGKIWFDSAPNKGTSFFVILPNKSII